MNNSSKQTTPSHWLIANYLTAALRNLRKNRLTTTLNVLGLTLGISCFTFIYLYIYSELNYDHQFEDAPRIYRATLSWRSEASGEEVNFGWSLTSLPEQLLTSCPEVEEATALVRLRHQAIVKVGADTFQEESLFETDTSFFRVFHPNIYLGNAATVGPASVVLTESLAKKYFGERNPLQQSIEINGTIYDVAAVLRDPPVNSSLQYNALLFPIDGYSNDLGSTFFKLYPNADPQRVERKITGFFLDEYGEHASDNNSQGYYKIERLVDMHFGISRLNDPPKGNIKIIWILATVGLLIIIISCINYINLNLSIASGRRIEIGIRRLLGANNTQNLIQFSLELLLIALFCFALSSLLITVGVSLLTSEGLLMLSFTTKDILIVAAGILTTLLLISILSGTYFSMQFKFTSLIDNLKERGGFKTSRIFRDSLLIFQFTTSIVLIFSSMIIVDQMDLLLNSTRKMNMDQVMVIDLPQDERLSPAVEGFTQLLDQFHYVQSVSFIGSESLPTEDPDYELFSIDNNEMKNINTFAYVQVDENFFSLMGIPLERGRNFSKSDLGDRWNSPIVNEAFVKSQGWKDDPLHHKISYAGQMDQGNTIIGVVKDFGIYNFNKKSEPMIFYPIFDASERLMVRLKASNNENITTIKNFWEQNIRVPMEFQFLNVYFQQVLKKEREMQVILVYFTIISVVIAALGLFGMINMSLTKNKKTISIRRIFGAEMIDLIKITWREYILVGLISVVIAYPVSYMPLASWQEFFTEKSPISIFIYLEAVLYILIVLLMAMGYHIIQIRNINYLKWIKNEE